MRKCTDVSTHIYTKSIIKLARDKWIDCLNSHVHACTQDTKHNGNSVWLLLGFIVCLRTTECNPFENSCSNTLCEDCHDTSRDLWPHLNITLEHYNELKYGIVISWKQPGNHCTFSLWLKFSQWMNPVLLCCFSVNVTGYVLLITMQPRSGRCGGGDLTGLNMCNCINITTAVGQIFVKSCRHVAMDALLY